VFTLYWKVRGRDDVASKIRELNGTKTVLITAYELDDEKITDLEKKMYC
jgi:hypothetical protein